VIGAAFAFMSVDALVVEVLYLTYGVRSFQTGAAWNVADLACVMCVVCGLASMATCAMLWRRERRVELAVLPEPVHVVLVRDSAGNVTCVATSCVRAA